jgi:hypothetical protein
MPDRPPAPPLFPCAGYAIGDERLSSHREVMIHCSDGPVPRLGDPFTIMRDKALLDLVVLDVLRTSLDWTARCGVVRTA